jgi:hypothetical protein
VDIGGVLDAVVVTMGLGIEVTADGAQPTTRKIAKNQTKNLLKLNFFHCGTSRYHV